MDNHVVRRAKAKCSICLLKQDTTFWLCRAVLTVPDGAGGAGSRLARLAHIVPRLPVSTVLVLLAAFITHHVLMAAPAVLVVTVSYGHPISIHTHQDAVLTSTQSCNKKINYINYRGL